MFHLSKSYNGTQTTGLACTNDIFTRGATLSYDEFMKAHQDGTKKLCKKCQKIADKKTKSISNPQ